MKERTLRSIVVILVVLVVVWGISVALGALRRDGPATGSGVAAALEGLGPESVQGISILPPGDEEIDLTAGDGGWSANGYPADSAALQRVWGALEEAEAGNVVATNPANHARMALTADSAWTVTFRTGSESSVVLIGESGPSFSSAYLRLPEEDAVVLVEGGLRGALARPLDQWRDRTILSVDTSRVARIRVERDAGETTVIERGEEGWTTNGEPARESTVQNLLREASRLTGSGFKDAETPLEEGNERRTVLEAEDGTVLAEVRFLGDGTTQHALVPGNETVFQVQSWRAERMTPAPAMALPPDPGG